MHMTMDQLRDTALTGVSVGVNFATFGALMGQNPIYTFSFGVCAGVGANLINEVAPRHFNGPYYPILASSLILSNVTKDFCPRGMECALLFCTVYAILPLIKSRFSVIS